MSDPLHLQPSNLPGVLGLHNTSVDALARAEAAEARVLALQREMWALQLEYDRLRDAVGIFTCGGNFEPDDRAVIRLRAALSGAPPDGSKEK